MKIYRHDYTKPSFKAERFWAKGYFDKEQLAFIRDEFACIMEQTNNANDELDIINKCCRLLEDPEFESFEEFQKNISGTWCEKEIEEE